MNLFSKFPTSSFGFLNIFKQLNFSDDLMQSDDYEIHEVSDTENLMTISYQYYDTVDDWWVLFKFNKLENYFFSIINETVINDTVVYYKNLIYDWSTITDDEKIKIKSLVRDYYYEKSRNIKDAIVKANDRLSTEAKREDDVFITDFTGFIYDDVITRSTFTTFIKVPSIQLVYKFKNELNNLSVSWANLEALND